MTSYFRPMLAADLDGEPRFPVLASPKLDGVRALCRDNQLISRSCKLIPNRNLQEFFRMSAFEGLDGELIAGLPYGPGVYNRSQSKVMTVAGGAEDVTWWVFDLHNFHPQMPFEERYETLLYKVAMLDQPDTRVVAHTLITSMEELTAFEEKCLAKGYEGCMIRDPKGPYKQGRSTLREGWLLKVKRFRDDEATIFGVEELMHNANALGEDERGYAKRTSHKENLVPMNILGALVCRTPEGVEFNIGTGFTEQERRSLWDVRRSLVGQVVKYKHFPAPSGVKDKPRHPVFLGLRAALDL